LGRTAPCLPRLSCCGAPDRDAGKEEFMKRFAPSAAVVVALVVLCGVVILAQNPAPGQKPPDPQAAAKPEQELPADWKAFNDIAAEKDVLKRAEAYEKFIKDNPQSDLVSMARSQVQSSILTVLRTSSAKYRDIITAQLDTAKAGNQATLYSAYARVASDLLSAGIMLDEAEEYARQSLSLMDEQKYLQYRQEMAQRSADAFAKRAANPAPAPAAPARPAMSFTSLNGAPVVRLAPPRPAPVTPPPAPTPPRMPTPEELRAGFTSERTSNLATLGQILMKRNKTAEGEKVLKEVYNAKPASYTLAAVARLLLEPARKAGNDTALLDYLATLALSGRITAAEQKEFEAVYRKTHNGSVQGLEEMLDERYTRESPRFTAAPANRKPVANPRAVLAEDFTGAG
jgi:hypothetical protein